MRTLDLSPAAAARALQGLRPRGDCGPEVYAAAVWSVLTEPGDGIAGRLVAEYGSSAALEVAEGSRAAPAASNDLAAARDRWLPRLEPRTIERPLALARRAGVRLVVPSDPEWPLRLDDLGDHAPHALWVRGDLAALAEVATLAVVGARAATGYGDHVATELSSTLAAEGVAIVSGAAYGIDGAAHRGALAAGGRTIALLAGGADRPYPSGHAGLIDKIVPAGAVVSETPCGTAPSKWRFLARNRLIAALGDATLVVEAGARSGSLNTAAHAATLGRPLGAVPGPVTSAASAGCHRILREFDGVCVTGVDDVRDLLGLSRGAPVVLGKRTGALTRVLDAASTRVPRTVADLAARSGLSPQEVEAQLGIAALAGEVERANDGWRRTTSR